MNSSKDNANLQFCRRLQRLASRTVLDPDIRNALQEAAAVIDGLERDRWFATRRTAGLDVETGTLRGDTERLDWLDSVTTTMNRHYGTVYGWKYDINHNRAALTNHNLPPLTARQAIDEAMDSRREVEARTRLADGPGSILGCTCMMCEYHRSAEEIERKRLAAGGKSCGE